MRIQIYQIHDFCPVEQCDNQLKTTDGKNICVNKIFPREDKNLNLERCYKKVYDNDINFESQEIFTGHSLSVSDIVVINNEMYGCNSIGWIKL